MAQLWKLVFLCGLLASTSASLLSGLTDVVDKAIPDVQQVDALARLTDVVDKAIPDVQQVDALAPLSQDLQLQSVLENLQGKDLLKTVTNVVPGGTTLLNNLVSGVGSLVAKLTGLRILDVKINVNNDGKSVDMRLPISANVTLSLPLVGQLAKLDISLDLLTTATVEDPNSDNPSPSLTKCKSDPASLKIKLLNGKLSLLNSLVNGVTNLLEKIVSSVVENVVCPLLQTLVKFQLGGVIKNILAQAKLGTQIGI